MKIWGCRGSLPVAGPDTQGYGGNTSCVEVRTEDGTVIVLDAGSGIRSAGLSLQEEMPETVHLLLTHLHLDHIMGFGFFLPLWSEAIDFHVWGPPSPFRSLEEQLIRYISPPLFPIHIGDAPPNLTIHDVPDGAWKIGSATIVADAVQHQGPTVGYRITDGGRTLAYIPDHEPARGIHLEDIEPDWLSGNSIAHDADLLMHDAQFSPEEYSSRIGWGHSAVDDAVRFAKLTHAKQLMMFHHDPLHSDDRLEELLAYATSMANGSKPVLARESMEFDL